MNVELRETPQHGEPEEDNNNLITQTCESDVITNYSSDNNPIFPFIEGFYTGHHNDPVIDKQSSLLIGF